MAKRKGRGKRHQGGGTATAESPESLVEPDLEKVLGAEAEADAKANGKQAAATPAPVGGDGAQEAPKKEDPAELERQRKAVAFDLIAKLNHDVSAAAIDYATANERAKEKKKRWEAMVLELQSAINKHEHPAPMPLFDNTPKTNGEHKPAEEAWRIVGLAEAMPELTERLIGLLNSEGLFTMGELADWQNKNQGWNKLTDISGIGKAAVDKIADAAEGFWSRQKESAEQKPEQVPDPQENGGQGDDAAGTEKEDEEAADDDQDEGDNE